jgi:hypothetical protein
MIIEVFGKQNCSLCESAKKKLAHFLGRWQLVDKVPVRFQDMESIDGATEGALHDVLEIPTTLVKDDERVVARWDGCQPDSRELRLALQTLLPDEGIVEAAG